MNGQPRTTMNNSRNWVKRFVYYRLEKFAMPRSDLVIATDETTAKLYSNIYPGIRSKLLIIPTGVNLQDCNPDRSFLNFPGLNPDVFNLAYIGRLAYPKQVHTIIAAFSNFFSDHPDTHLWIAGTGPDLPKLQTFASKLSCWRNIHFTGHLDRENVLDLILSSDAGILISHNEGSPIIVKEFLACGKPMIVNDVGDVRKYVTDGINGYIVDSKQIDTISLAIKNIMKNAGEMKIESRKSVLSFDEDQISEKVFNALMLL